MKNYSSVPHILSAAHHVAGTPSTMDIIHQENVDIGVVFAAYHLFVFHALS